MKLYYSPGACSLSPHIILCELGLTPELVKVNLRDHKTEDGQDYYAITFKGAVPLLELDNGERLSEGAAITQYLADANPAKNLIPKVGAMERYRVVEWQSFISDIHRCYAPLFHAEGTTEEMQKAAMSKLAKHYTWIDGQLKDKAYLMGESFTIPDAYLFVTLRWAYALKVPITGLANLRSYFDRVKSRPAVQEALKTEGLL
ncbi:MAG: glutathione transferase GstA [Saezia sp.]